MNVLAELQKRAHTVATPATPATQWRLSIVESQESQESQGMKVETALCPAPTADPAVRVLRARLLALADRLGIDSAHVHRIAETDLALWATVPDGALRAYLLALDDTATRQAGKVPLTDTAAIHCERCGPVYVHRDIAAVLPVVNGWPRALGCPWCFVRKAGGYIPRPPVTCEGCRHFSADTINPTAGIGTCGSGHGMHYPMQHHGCGDYRPKGTDHD